MRVATFVLGISLSIAGGVSEASESFQNPSAYGYGVSPLLASEGALSPSAALYARDAGVRNGLGAMSFLPSQNPAYLLRSHPNFGEPRQLRAEDRFDPGRIPLPASRSVEDHWLTGFIAVMLIAYQLRRKHRFLRPHQFST